MGAERPIDVLCFGEALVDFFPADDSGGALETTDVYRRHLGGAPTNVAVGLARLGRKSASMTLVGPDAFGRWVRAALEAEGVDVATVGTHPSAKTGITFVAVAKDGARSFLFFRHPSADQMIAPQNVEVAALSRTRVFHFGSSTMSREPARAATLFALDAAKRAGCVISCDPNWRPHLWQDAALAPELIREVLAGVELLKVSDDELAPLVDTSDVVEGARRLIAMGPRVVFVTRASAGCVVALRGGEVVEVATTAERAIDATGAGDAFVAGVLDVVVERLSAGESIDRISPSTFVEAARAGNRLGGQAVRAMGATSAIARRAPGRTS